jgi:hypothetical protein
MVVSLSWVMSLSAPTVLAFDQLDSIVTEHHLLSGSGLSERMHDKQMASLAIIEGLAGGLTALHSLLFKTLSLFSCLESTWNILTERTLGTRRTASVRSSSKESRMDGLPSPVIFSRLKSAQIRLNFTPPYPSWPFREGFFRTAAPLYPRVLLQRCDAHRQKCLVENVVTELDRFTGPSLEPPPVVSTELDAKFDQLCSLPVVTINETSEDELLPDLHAGGHELSGSGRIRFPAALTRQVETSFPERQTFSCPPRTAATHLS